ncbi:MAG: response regulator transcription factor [Gemmatimonadaceae bacterium]|nr:response regulator transcription factor [Gemmatimonadaceae bacterium]
MKSHAPPLLIVDDEPQIRRAVGRALASITDTTLEAATGAEAIDLAAAVAPALVVLDLGLPDMDGVEVCRRIRAWSDVPVLVLTARHQEESTVEALDAGADDYVTKPFRPPELLARARALLRRTRQGNPAASAVVTAGALTIDVGARTVTRNGTAVHLTPTEWELLVVLATHAGRVFTHQHLFATVWKGREFGDAQAHLRVHLAHLRRKLEEDPVRPRHLVTELGVGYRFVP